MRNSVVTVDSREAAMKESGDIILSGVSTAITASDLPFICNYHTKGGDICRNWRSDFGGQTSASGPKLWQEISLVQIPR